jgi:hypothetical protein
MSTLPAGVVMYAGSTGFEVRALWRRLSDFAIRYARRQRLYELDDVSINDLGRERVREELMRPLWRSGFSDPPGNLAAREKALKSYPLED